MLQPLNIAGRAPIPCLLPAETPKGHANTPDGAHVETLVGCLHPRPSLWHRRGPSRLVPQCLRSPVHSSSARRPPWRECRVHYVGGSLLPATSALSSRTVAIIPVAGNTYNIRIGCQDGFATSPLPRPKRSALCIEPAVSERRFCYRTTPGYSCPSCLHLAPAVGTSAKLVCNFHVLCSSSPKPPAHVGWLGFFD
jgi:hypothetical protein